MNRYKPVLCGLLQLIFISFTSAQWSNDTVVKGVSIQFNYTTTIFPETWREQPISATGERLDETEIRRSAATISAALTKYPTVLLKENLRAVFVLKSMKFFNVGYGGTNSSDAIYLTNSGEVSGYTNSYLEQTFHHEFSSILLRNYPSLIDTTAWLRANQKGFRYNDPENGVGAIRKNLSSQEVNENLCKKGFLTQYALSSIENDMNTFAQYLFLPPPGFWKTADRFPKVRQKLNLMISFYRKLNPVFTEAFFRKLKTAQP